MLVKQRFLKSTKLLVAVAVALPVSVVLISSMYAPSAHAADNTANALKISPVRTDVQVKQGETKVVPITATNTSNKTVSVKVIENDFVSGDERGTPALILDENKFAPSHSLKRYMVPVSDVLIPAGKSKIIDVKVVIPADAPAGGYFGAIRLAPTDPDTGGQVNMSASVASLLLVTVPGEVAQKLSLTDFSIQQKGHTDTFFMTPESLQLTVSFQNDGGLQLSPMGKVSVLQGKKVVYDADFNDGNPRDMILPASARRWDIPFEKISTFGHYTVQGTFTYGTTNQTIEVSKSFWVVPLWMIIAAIAVVVILIGVIVLIVVLVIRRNKRRPGRKSAKHGFGI